MYIHFSDRNRDESRDAYLRRKLREAREESISSHRAVKVSGYFFSNDIKSLEEIYGFLPVGLSNICHTDLEISIFEIPSVLFLNFNLVYILYIFHLDLAILMVSLENYYIPFPNILIYS